MQMITKQLNAQPFLSFLLIESVHAGALELILLLICN